jgi:hypothetical protein
MPFDETNPALVDRRQYLASLESFDIAVCEAVAVSQAASGRMATPHHGYGSYIFTCLCNGAVSLIRAAPLSRWTRSDFQHWAFISVAPYARAIIEGHILFTYVMEGPGSDEEWSAKINVMHLNDCARRMTLHTNLGVADQVAAFQGQAEELRERLCSNTYFQTLEANVRRRCLEGESPMISTRSELLDKIGWDRGHFRAMYDLLPQHTHILPLSFYRLEPNGRGTGLENQTDRGYISMSLELCAEALQRATDTMVLAFPDTASARQGKKSKFSPGPRGNLPR